MTYEDYFDWAEEYRSQLDVLDKKIAKRIAFRKKTNINHPMNEAILSSLYEMRRECEKTYIILRKKAEKIKRDEA